MYNPPPMLWKVALLIWFVAMAFSFLAKAQGRVWMMRLFIGGLCLLLLGLFFEVMKRVI
jgi:heme O synthase-like polyprenyltransferase